MDNTKDLFHALQRVAEHCEVDDVACAGVSLAVSALCEGDGTLAEAEIKARVLGDMMLENLRDNWDRMRADGQSGRKE